MRGTREVIRQPRHARPCLLASRRLLLGVVLASVTSLGIVGCAAMTGSGATAHQAAARPVNREIVGARTVGTDDADGLARDAWSRRIAHAAPTSAVPAAPVADTTQDTAPASALAASGIPTTALDAYRQAAVREATRRPSCGLTWPLLAGIGRVESDHGRFAGAILHADGLSVPRIVGIPLDGHGTALITDTDGGRLDGDTGYDRAVGPMQFIPSTWAGWGVDANADGRADPFNLFDAAAAAADYLCAAGRDLRTYAGEVQAVRSYNNSDAYIALVLRLERVYASGAVGVSVPVLPTDPDPVRIRPPHGRHLPPVDPGKPRGTTPPHPGGTHHPGSSSTHPTSTSAPSTGGSSGSTDPTCPPSTDTTASSIAPSSDASTSASSPSCGKDSAPPTDSTSDPTASP